MPVRKKNRPNRKTIEAIKSRPIRVEWPDIPAMLELFDSPSVTDDSNGVSDTGEGDFCYPISLKPKKSIGHTIVRLSIGFLALIVVAGLILSLFPHLLF